MGWPGIYRREASAVCVTFCSNRKKGSIDLFIPGLAS